MVEALRMVYAAHQELGWLTLSDNCVEQRKVYRKIVVSTQAQVDKRLESLRARLSKGLVPATTVRFILSLYLEIH